MLEVNVLMLCAARLRSRIIYRVTRKGKEDGLRRDKVSTCMRTRPDDDLYLLDGPYPIKENKRDDLGKEADLYSP